MRTGLSDEEGVQIAREILAVTEGWEAQMQEAEVSAQDIAVLQRCFAFQSVLTGYVKNARISGKKTLRKLG